MRISTLLVILLPLPALVAAQGSANPVATDSGLIVHLKNTDPVLRQSLSKCTNEVVTRNTHGSRVTFVYRAVCQQQVPPSAIGDCHYRVEARGTIDSAEWATVRSWRLNLECSG